MEESDEEPEEEREGKLIVEEDRSVEDTAEQEVASEEQSKLEDPSREVIPVEFSSDNAVEEVQTGDPLGPPEKGRTGSGIMHPFVDLGEEVEIVAEEEGSLAESEKLVIEPILITSTEPTRSSSSTTTSPTSTTTTIRPTSEASSLPQKKEEKTSVHPLPFPFQTTTAASESSTSEAPPTTTTSSERMEKLLEMAMERLKEMEETPESSSDS